MDRDFNVCIAADVSVAIPYDRSFVVSDEKKPGYLAASLAARVKPGREKGYRLVGSNRNALTRYSWSTIWDTLSVSRNASSDTNQQWLCFMDITSYASTYRN